MIRGLYSASSAIDVASQNQDLIADNLANCTTPGYRRRGMTFDVLQAAANDGTSGNVSGVRNSGVFTSFEPGPMQQTGNPLDFALSGGDAFFVLEGPRGPVYTRNGSFELNSQGELQSKGGLRVRSQGGRLVIPNTASTIRVTSDGVVQADGSEVGRLELAQFTAPNQLQRAGPTLFDGATPRTPEPGTVQVNQGYREGSNVQVVQEMISMMIGMRQYEAAERAMRAMSEAVAQNTKPQ
ncbi:MAG: flagellar hook basal-body protein [Planctomycetes bacterium]|nr:flagellar hook basal-body protein [Planctomycetota bacterium]